MKIIGLCGGSGSGKGAVAEIFTDAGIPVVDTDNVYHIITSSDSECLRELTAFFGNTVISDSGALDRTSLARIVFADGAGEKHKKLNEITHKHILLKTREMIYAFANDGYEFSVVDAPLLYESGFDKECDAVIAVVADRDIRIARIIKRDGLTEEQAIRRIDSQMNEAELRQRADYVISNNGTISDLEEKVKSIIGKIRSK